ncbi:hypothetical protein ACFQPG_05120 [Sphingomonas sp. GCM10030256]|uniref:hypothetical protein n=1 Tax=Sphingomonas sp. GCM10030256 TaxID=3273427 RepID=UPI003614C83C
MRVLPCITLAALLAIPSVAQAMIVVVFTEPMSLEKRAIVLGSSGPDRLVMCPSPTAVNRCKEVPVVRRGKR